MFGFVQLCSARTGRTKLGLAGSLQLFPALVWLGLYPIRGERLEQWCSCDSNCAHLHSPHHPPRCLENKRFHRMVHGSSDKKAKKWNWKGRQTRPRAQPNSSSPFFFQTLCCSLAEWMLLLTSSCSSLSTTAIKQNALFMKLFSQIHSATSSESYVCIYFNWKDSSKVFGVRLTGSNTHEFVNEGLVWLIWKQCFTLETEFHFLYFLTSYWAADTTPSLDRSIPFSTLLQVCCRRQQGRQSSCRQLTAVTI